MPMANNAHLPKEYGLLISTDLAIEPSNQIPFHEIGAGSNTKEAAALAFRRTTTR